VTVPPEATALPEGFTLRLDRRARWVEGRRALLGGTPTRLLRLTPTGAELVARWSLGEQPDSLPARTLARRLVGAGIAHPQPRSGSLATTETTIVVPVRDRPVALERCLATLAATGARLLVVDDGSRDAQAISAVAQRHGAELVRSERSSGAAAARNRGLARSNTAIVAFVDSDCVASGDWLDRLVGHLADASVAAAAPRIVAADATTTTRIGQYEAKRSPLDMGPAEGAVAPLTRLPFVPSAALVVRRVAAGSGFDETMPIGEDVDFVWRLTAAGWSVRYDPSVTVAHHHRDTFAPWLRRRFVYAASAAALARRHPGMIPAAVVSRPAAAACALLAARRPLAAGALVLGAAAWAALPSRRGELSAVERARIAAAGASWSAWSLSVAATRSWLPLAAAAAVRSPRARRSLLLLSVAPRALELQRRARGLPPVTALSLSLLDDAAYAAGLWWGCVRHRTVAPLLPSIRSAGLHRPALRRTMRRAQTRDASRARVSDVSPK
jgi:mycofactocin system glycosyltransferase